MALTLSTYGSTAEADTYFATKLYIDAWTGASTPQKTAAITMASERVDRLNFLGDKSDPAQYRQWPRKNLGVVYSNTTPEDILKAVYEIAFQYLDGKEDEPEAISMLVNAESFGSVRTNYKGDVLPEHLQAGIISAVAWRYLRPFLRDPRELRLER